MNDFRGGAGIETDGTASYQEGRPHENGIVPFFPLPFFVCSPVNMVLRLDGCGRVGQAGGWGAIVGVPSCVHVYTRVNWTGT